MINYLIDNCYITCGDSTFRQKIGIPMGTDCVPFLANLFSYNYETAWMTKTAKTDKQLARRFNKSARYIDDLLTINNDELMKEHMSDMYPRELELKHENSDDDKSATYLDLQLNVNNGEIVKSLHDKRDDFPFIGATSCFTSPQNPDGIAYPFGLMLDKASPLQNGQGCVAFSGAATAVGSSESCWRGMASARLEVRLERIRRHVCAGSRL